MEPSGSIERAAISIHAPTRGATILLSRCLQFIRFQSTLPRGERQKKERCYKWHSGFQSTLPRGERQLRQWLAYPLNAISIHAPTRGATGRCMDSSCIIGFQSTLPRGERLGDVWIVVVLSDFNPRSHEGSDSSVRFRLHGLRRFQSTLPRGERPCIPRPPPYSCHISIHAPTRGATHCNQYNRRQ